MKSITINGSQRESVGKSATKALRNAGQVPCVIYGGDKPVHFSAEELEDYIKENPDIIQEFDELAKKEITVKYLRDQNEQQSMPFDQVASLLASLI